MTSKRPVQCAACKHWRDRRSPNPTCDAFPGGIPLSIAMFGEDHRTPRKGDHGVRFELKEGPEAQADFDNWMFVFSPEEWEAAQRGNQAAGSQKGGDEA